MSVKHSPLPWKACCWYEWAGKNRICIEVEGDQKHPGIATLSGSYLPAREVEANAEFIVEAANSHYALKAENAALKDALCDAKRETQENLESYLASMRPYVDRLKSMGFEIGYGFEYGRNGDQSHSNFSDAFTKAMDELAALKERVKALEELSDNLYGLVCNVDNGDIEKQGPVWNDAFVRCRTMYLKSAPYASAELEAKEEKP